jgi:hypothetical protein
MRYSRRVLRAFFLASAALACAAVASCNRDKTAAPRGASTPVVGRPPPEPAAVAARAANIRHDADAIRGECQHAAGGDWDKWQRDTERYRVALRGRLDALQTFEPARSSRPEAQYEALEGRDGFPLFEVGARLHLNYLYLPHSLDPFRKDRPVAAARRWLAQRGIDLIFVPVPKMTEVYVEHFLDPCPSDGVITPAIRRCLLELLDDDVEVIDGFSLFRPKREAEYLYLPADSHWNPAGMRVTARELADRVARYEFGKTARQAAPVARCDPEGGKPPGQDGLVALSEAQRARAAAVTRNLPRITTRDGKELLEHAGSPVLVIGNSYVDHFREIFIQELNLMSHFHWGPGHTTEAFADFVREPDLLDNCRVVVWITTAQHLTHFKPLPDQIAYDGR